MNAALPPSRILFVEDHADTADVFSRLLEARGFRVMVAATAASALDLARRFPFDLLLCDIELPDGDGCQLLTRLRGELRMDTLRAIAFSAHGYETILDRAKAAGFEAYMLKPVVIKDLFELLEQVYRSDPPLPSAPRQFIAVRSPS
jgi:CheY-like chemotaxis protein